MKLKTILTATLAVSLMAGVTSCEDMLSVDSKTVMYDYQNTLDSPTDTVYSVLGIIKKIQAIADRTVILGEIRGDLVNVSGHASDDLLDLYNMYKTGYQGLKSDNKYDQAVDYYSVINNCNFFLTNVDTAFTRNQQHSIMKGEYIIVLCYRAWAYLQLAQAYGVVPYFDKPVTSDNASTGVKMNIKELAQTLLLDFKDEYITYMDKYSPNYGEIAEVELGDGSKSQKHKSKEFFIPLRLIMGDLCLWAEDYANAALYYTDFLAGDNRSYTTGTNNVTWRTNDFLVLGSDSYYNLFSDNGYICYIPMEGDKYNGTVSELIDIFNSTYENDYWYQLTASRALRSTSARQNYCYHAKRPGDNPYEWAAYMADKSNEEEMYRGDLRLSSILETEYEVWDEDDTEAFKYGTEIQTLNKFNSEKIWLYRKDVVYLRLAEALNRCGLPQTAFAILKDGLCRTTIDSLSQGEKDRATNIGGVDVSKVYDQSTFATSTKFTKVRTTWSDVNITINGSEQQYTVASWANNGNTMGIHSRGCGDAAYDDTYRIMVDTVGRTPTLEDSIRAVEESLITEMALETCFEGYRFGDLMRISMHRAADPSSPGYGGFAENDFLARRVAARESAKWKDTEDYYDGKDEDLYKQLLGDGSTLNKSWFLYLPDEK